MNGGIPSFSYRYSKQWHCNNDTEFLFFIDSQFLLPRQLSWQEFRLYFALSTKVISELVKKANPMGEWKRLWLIGKGYGGYGVPIANPSELTHTWRKSISKPKQGLLQDFQATYEKSVMAVEIR